MMANDKKAFDFEALIQEFLPHWHRRDPDELVSFGELSKTQPIYVCNKILRSFMTGRLPAFNPRRNSPARCFSTTENMDYSCDHLSGTFLNNYEGKLEFEQPTERLMAFGVLELGHEFFSSRPFWSFTLHKHVKISPSQIPLGETLVFNINYKRVAESPSPKSIQIYIKHELNGHVALSASCEGRYYRATNEKMWKAASAFLEHNRIQVQPKERHTLLEEIIFLIFQLEDNSFSHSPVPERQISAKDAASQNLAEFIFGLVFLKIDIQKLLHEPTPRNSRPTAQLNGVTNFIFRKQKAGYWDVQYCSEKHEIPDSKGMMYIHFFIGAKGSYYTLQEVYDAFSITGTEDAHIDPTIYYDTIKKKRLVLDYNEKINNLKNEIDKIREALDGLTNAKHEDIVYAKELIEEKQDDIAFLDNEISKLNRGYEIRSKSNKDKGGSVNIAIKRAIDLIEGYSPDLANHLRESFVKTNVRKTRGPGTYVKRAYVQDMDINWVLD